MTWLVVAYYTGHPIYRESSRRLERSLKAFGIPYDIQEIQDRGDWYSNMQAKPKFIMSMILKHNPLSLVYVDADAEFVRFPSLFDSMCSDRSLSIAVHTLDHSKYRRRTHPPEMLSGTIFMNNTPETYTIVEEWIEECKTDPRLWDQQALHTVLKKHRYGNLPEEYCVIFDYMSSVTNKVIVHYQASRVAKRATGRTK